MLKTLLRNQSDWERQQIVLHLTPLCGFRVDVLLQKSPKSWRWTMKLQQQRSTLAVLFDLFLFGSSDKHCLFLKVQLWSTRVSENLRIGSSHPASFLGFEQCSELHFSIFLHVSSLEMLQLHRRRTEHSKWNTNNCRIASASPVSQQHILRPVNTPMENTDRPDVNTVTASHPEAPGTEEQTDSLTKQKWFHCALKADALTCVPNDRGQPCTFPLVRHEKECLGSGGDPQWVFCWSSTGEHQDFRLSGACLHPAL